ncbi:MAG: glycosidase, partial [Gammaproteobacteria bacterium]|nr:glycosidase [Gammaproteobacteria bacterium]
LQRPVVLDQLKLIQLRNTSPAFNGEMKVIETEPHLLHINWQHPDVSVTLKANLSNHDFTIYQDDGTGEQVLMSFES